MGKFTDFKLPLKSMPEGVHSFEYHLGKQFFVNMESADVHDADLDVQLTVTLNHDLYQLDFNITGQVTLICDRCLDSLIWPIETAYSIAVKYGDDYNDDSDDLLVIPWADNFLNVAYIIYETVVLAIPIKHVHPLGKCNRQMSAMLKKHRSNAADPEEAQLQESLIDEMESMPDELIDDSPASDPRWDALKGLSSNPE